MRYRAIQILMVAQATVVSIIWISSARQVAAQAVVSPHLPALTFDVASVRQYLAGEGAVGANAPRVNFPIGSDDAFYNTGGMFSATNLPLLSYLIFAYKINTNNRQALVESLPEWVKDEHYNIEARTDAKNVTKDQMRFMMQTLLVERFSLAVHRETRVVNVFAAVLNRSGTLGPQLRVHSSRADCPEQTANTATSTQAPGAGAIDHLGFANVCGKFVNVMRSDQTHHRRFGGGKLTVATIVSSFTGVGGLTKPVIDRTGLAGEYDFFLDFLPTPSPNSDPQPNEEGPEFVEAVKAQLGIKLISDKAPLDFVLVDHIQHPTPN